MDIQKKVIQILDKSKKNFSDLKTIILNVRNQSLKLSDCVIEYGLSLVQNHKSKLGDEYYIVLEEIFYAGLEISSPQTVRLSQKCLLKIKQKFPESEKVERMESMLYEAKRDEQNSLDVLQSQIRTNLVDIESQKRRIASFRRDGQITKFIEELNSYLEQNSSDGEAWMELGDIYLETLNYSKAVYCYEELLVLYPKKFFYMVKIAEIYYTMGGQQNLNNAKHYYSFALSKDSQNFRALWGLIQTCRRLQAIKKESKIQELLELCTEALQQHYKKQNSSKLIEKIDWSKFTKN